MKIYLIGFMGSGKSYIGKRLAQRLDYEFCDLDDLIEEMTGTTINEIFQTKGEKDFRLKEQQALLATEKMTNTIIACGGGTPCFFNNMQIINSLGKSIFIDRSPTKIVEHLSGEQAKRPLVSSLTKAELLPFIEKKLSQRLPFYQQASYIFNPENEKLAPAVALENWVHFVQGWS